MIVPESNTYVYIIGNLDIAFVKIGRTDGGMYGIETRLASLRTQFKDYGPLRVIAYSKGSNEKEVFQRLHPYLMGKETFKVVGLLKNFLNSLTSLEFEFKDFVDFMPNTFICSTLTPFRSKTLLQELPPPRQVAHGMKAGETRLFDHPDEFFVRQAISEYIRDNKLGWVFDSFLEKDSSGKPTGKTGIKRTS